MALDVPRSRSVVRRIGAALQRRTVLEDLVVPDDGSIEAFEGDVSEEAEPIGAKATAAPTGTPGEASLFEQGARLWNAGDYQAAAQFFYTRAEASTPRFPQRAAIAFRQAALAAALVGGEGGEPDYWNDRADHWMRLAGREYLRVSESPEASVHIAHQASIMAAKCFSNVRNVELETKGMTRARSIRSVLGPDLGRAATD